MQYVVIIEDYDIIDQAVYYKIRTFKQETNRLVIRRYSEIKSMHKLILEINVKYKLNEIIPQFPKRSLFCATNKVPEQIEKRRYDLQTYLNCLLNMEKFRAFDVIQQFLPDPIGTSTIRPNIADPEYIKYQAFQEADALRRAYLEKEQCSLNHRDHTTSSQQLQNLIQRYTFQVENHMEMNDIVAYKFTLNDSKNLKKWSFTVRFSELRNYHKMLIRTTNLEIQFPKRQIIKATNSQEGSIIERHRALESYLNTVFSQVYINNISYPELENSEILKHLIQKIKLEGQEVCKKGSPAQSQSPIQQYKPLQSISESFEFVESL